MNKTTLNMLLLTLALLAAQAVVFNNLVLFGVAVPMVFIYAIVAQSVTLGTNWSVTLGFLIGLAADVFADTYGVNAVSCTLLAFVRKPVFHLYVQRDEDPGDQLSNMRVMGVPAFMKYAATMVLIYCTVECIVEAFGVYHILRMLVRILASTVYTLLIIYALDSLSLRRKRSN